MSVTPSLPLHPTLVCVGFGPAARGGPEPRLTFPPSRHIRTASDNLDLLIDVPVRAAVRLGTCQASLKDILELGVGSTLSLDPTELVDLVIEGRPIAKGRIVTVEDHFSIQLTSLTSPHDDAP